MYLRVQILAERGESKTNPRREKEERRRRRGGGKEGKEARREGRAFRKGRGRGSEADAAESAAEDAGVSARHALAWQAGRWGGHNSRGGDARRGACLAPRYFIRLSLQFSILMLFITFIIF